MNYKSPKTKIGAHQISYLGVCRYFSFNTRSIQIDRFKQYRNRLNTHVIISIKDIFNQLPKEVLEGSSLKR